MGSSAPVILGAGVPRVREAPRAPKAAAFTQYPRRVRNMSCAWKDNGVIHLDRRKFTHMGYSARTTEWRYTEWVPWNGTTLRALWDAPLAGVELYDHRNETTYPTNFDCGENVNVAAAPGNAAVVEELQQLLRAHFGPERGGGGIERARHRGGRHRRQH